ncbi:ABC transporter permease [Xylanibacillus composti]|uniref:ABC transporter permease n=1 Tax=Xylanibacillus composti TaxID=1572762 RepID=UPI001FD0CDC7|nr:ABC transporter permease [Xylanibacillus composti]
MRVHKPDAAPLFLGAVRAAAMKELQIAARYLPNSIGYLVQMAIRILFFLVLSDNIALQGEQSLAGDRLFIFFISAMLIWIFSGVALQAPLSAVTNDLYNGTLEYLYSNPISRYAYFLGTVLGGVALNLIFFLPLYVMLIMYAGLGVMESFIILAVCVLVLASLVALGVMIALLGILFRQAQALAGVLAMLLEFVAGAYFPVSHLPPLVQTLAYMLPFTWAYDLVRYYSLQTEWSPLLPIGVEWGILGAYALLFTLLSVFLLHKVERVAKKKGFHLL